MFDEIKLIKNKNQIVELKISLKRSSWIRKKSNCDVKTSTKTSQWLPAFSYRLVTSFDYIQVSCYLIK